MFETEYKSSELNLLVNLNSFSSVIIGEKTSLTLEFLIIELSALIKPQLTFFLDQTLSILKLKFSFNKIGGEERSWKLQ